MNNGEVKKELLLRQGALIMFIDKLIAIPAASSEEEDEKRKVIEEVQAWIGAIQIYLDEKTSEAQLGLDLEDIIAGTDAVLAAPKSS